MRVGHRVFIALTSIVAAFAPVATTGGGGQAEAQTPPAADVERQDALSSAFSEGMRHFQEGDTTSAIKTWEVAHALRPEWPDIAYNLAVLHATQGRLSRAVELYREALDILEGMGPAADAADAEARLETRQNALAGLLSAGARTYEAGRDAEAAEVFGDLTKRDPNNRDAWYNSALALYRLGRWDDLIPVARRVIAVDPLNENARVILFNAYKGIAEATPPDPRAAEMRGLALRALEESDALPVYTDEHRFENAGRMTATVTGNTAPAGQQITLEYTFYGPFGQVGIKSVSFAAPASGERLPISVTLPAGAISSFSYRVR